MPPMAATLPEVRLSPQGRRALRWVAILAAVVGVLLGIETLVLHLTTDPLIDIRRYYEAGARLNAGQPLYGQTSADTTATYLYPPLLAIVFRPLALLPFPIAAGIWEAVIVAAFALTLRRIGIRPRVLLVLGLLALPTAWALTIGQAQVLVTLLLALGAPWSVALAGQLKVVPVLAALYWVGRGDRRALAQFVAWSVGLVALQVVLAPKASLDFLGTLGPGQIGHVNNFSPWVLSPFLWAILFVVGMVITVALARTHWGWAAAVALSTLAPPRLLTYMLSSLLAVCRRPDGAEERQSARVRAPDAPRARV